MSDEFAEARGALESLHAAAAGMDFANEWEQTK